MKIIFLGTPDFALKPLEYLLTSRHEVVAAVTQPDRPFGRNMDVKPSPVKRLAEERGLKVLQFEKISRDGVDALRALKPDIMVTCAYGQILSREVLNIAPYGIINVHASLLPKYRGAAPIQWCIINGDSETGVTIMQTAEGIDTGDIIYTEKTPIFPNETAGELFIRLSEIGANALISAIELIDSGKANPVKQDEGVATYVRMLKKTDGRINFGLTAKQICNLVRGVNPSPGAYAEYLGGVLKIWSCTPAESSRSAACGDIVEWSSKSGIFVSCADGAVRLGEVQIAGSRRMDSADFVKGHGISFGHFGDINE